MSNNLINLFSRNPQNKSAKTVLNSIVDKKDNEQIDLNELFADVKDSIFLVRAKNDYLMLVENDWLIVNVNFKPKPQSLVCYSLDGKSGICLMRDLSKHRDVSIHGVVTHHVRNLEAEK